MGDSTLQYSGAVDIQVLCAVDQLKNFITVLLHNAVDHLIIKADHLFHTGVILFGRLAVVY